MGDFNNIAGIVHKECHRCNLAFYLRDQNPKDFQKSIVMILKGQALTHSSQARHLSGRKSSFFVS